MLDFNSSRQQITYLSKSEGVQNFSFLRFKKNSGIFIFINIFLILRVSKTQEFEPNVAETKNKRII